MVGDTSNGGHLSEERIKQMAEEHGIHISFPQKSMDDDNPTIPVNRGAAGVYMPEPNEEDRAKKDMMNAISKYLRISKHDMIVENVTVDRKCYCISITYEYQSGEITHNPKETR